MIIISFCGWPLNNSTWSFLVEDGLPFGNTVMCECQLYNRLLFFWVPVVDVGMVNDLRWSRSFLFFLALFVVDFFLAVFVFYEERSESVVVDPAPERRPVSVADYRWRVFVNTKTRALQVGRYNYNRCLDCDKVGNASSIHRSAQSILVDPSSTGSIIWPHSTAFSSAGSRLVDGTVLSVWTLPASAKCSQVARAAVAPANAFTSEKEGEEGGGKKPEADWIDPHDSRCTEYQST